MRHTDFQVLRAVILAKDPTIARRLATILDINHRYQVVSLHTDLSQAHAAICPGTTDVVLCDHTVHHVTSFASFRATVIAAGCRLITIPDNANAAQISLLIGPRGNASGPVNMPHHAGGAPGQAQAHKLVVIGASTGGIEALHRVLSAYPEGGPPTAIVQHIKPEFLSGVVARLDRNCAARVVEATDRTVLRPGLVAVAPGLACHLVVEPASLRCRLRPAPPVSGHRPSVDCLFQSAAHLGPAAVGVILTGMGRDGATGLSAMRRAGAWTIAQDKATSTVFGMPRVAQEEGAVSEMLPLRRIGAAILRAAATSTEINQ